MIHARTTVAALLSLLTLCACGPSAKDAPPPKSGGDETVTHSTVTTTVASDPVTPVATAAPTTATTTTTTTTTPTGDCASVGGTCVGVGDCGKGQGHLSSTSCNKGPSIACCMPATACGGPDEFNCCGGSATFRPSCDGGTLTCLPGQTRCK